MGFLGSLECLCVTAMGKILPGEGSILNAKLNCDPTSLSAKIIATGHLQSAPEKYYVEKCIDSYTGYGPLYNITINLEGLENLTVGTIGSIKHKSDDTLLSTFYYRVTNIDGNVITIQYLNDTANLGDIELYYLCTKKEYCEAEHSGYTYTGSKCVQCISFEFYKNRTNPRIDIQPALRSSSIIGIGNIKPKLSVDFNPANDIVGVGDIKSKLSVEFNIHQKLYGSGIVNTYADKFNGNFGNFECLQKLYPIEDVAVTGETFVGPNLETTNLYSFIDEGVFTGEYTKKFGNSELIADDQNSYIQASGANTQGTFSYKCKVNKPIVRPDLSSFRIRTSAPISNAQVDLTPAYTIKDIKFEDPSGNLIVEYDDIYIRGDGGFATYSSLPKNNLAKLNDWNPSFPFLQEPSNYTLSFKILADAFDDPFDPGFNVGFEENYRHEPTGFLNTIKISAIEICNSGRLGPGIENYIPIYYEVQKAGNRIERKIYPIAAPLIDFDTGIYPSVSSVWYTNDDPTQSNTNKCGTSALITALRNDSTNDYITLKHTSLTDSGKLTLKFGHEPVGLVSDIQKGAFDCNFDQSVCDIWIQPSGAFNTLNKVDMYVNDHFFVVETVSLKVLAKKAIGSRNYALDIVGYSDDGLLNITSAVGGFLQNVSGVGTIPLVSGFNPVDDLGLDGETTSDRDQYFIDEITNSPGGDHYLLSNTPLISSTSYEWYEIPLKVYTDIEKVGSYRNYSMSSMFEKLVLDVFPIPSGASIAAMHLLVRYKPQTALTLLSQGGEHIGRIQNGRSEGLIVPTSRQTNDYIINAGSGYNPLSYISGIPQAYSTTSSLKSNYARRWRGVNGLMNGPFDPDQFSFAYKNDTIDSPFLLGWYDFDNDYGNNVIPKMGTLSGVINNANRYKNIGWRFKNSTIFNGYTGPYETIDWTSLNDGMDDFTDNPLYGHIADAFNNAVRLSGVDSYINFGDFYSASGFSIFLRFSPDIAPDATGSPPDVFSNRYLVSKWEIGTTSSKFEYALKYHNERLRVEARDAGGTTHHIDDTVPYSGYQFPLSVIFTYNDDGTKKLKLYTDNEFASGWQYLRAASTTGFNLYEGSGGLLVGYGGGNVSNKTNIFVSEIGISNSGNIVESNADLTNKQLLAEHWFDTHRVKWWNPNESYINDRFKLWDYVNEDIYHDWQIGAFKYCEFDVAFDQLQKRSGKDFISFNIKSDGIAYKNKTDLALPSSINQNVSYHSQIENDFLRFNLSDTAETFYSTYPRISKNLPRGYKFADKAIVVESIIEHNSSGNIAWDDCKIGPKLIVSLYTKRQQKYWQDDKENIGLINRSIHYLDDHTCIERLDSKFTYEDICDDSEEWAIFPMEARLKEFDHKYYSQDIDEMFLQYDIVYPSGSEYTSRLNLHSINVRLEDALIDATPLTQNLNLVSSGGYPVDEMMNLLLEARLFSSGNLNLYTLGPILIQESGFPTYTSGILWAAQDLGFSVSGSPVVINNNFNIYSSGSPELIITPDSGGLNLHMFAKAIISGNMPLVAFNQEGTNAKEYLKLYNFASLSGVATSKYMPMFIMNNHDIKDSNFSSGTLNLRMLASPALVDFYPDGSMSLFIFDNKPSSNMNLVLYADPVVTANSGSMNMFAVNYGFAGSPLVYWEHYNYGTDIDLEDNIYASIAANDEIRGVNLIGYGACDSDSTRKAIDDAIITHDTVWRPAVCNDGGIFRAIKTYTNLDVGYSGNYYGIRKYEGLRPNAAYQLTLKVTTGSTEAIKVPREFEEWEYGTNETINFSGIKLIGDYPYLSGDLSLTLNLPSGRNANDTYGKSVVAKKDLLAVGSPLIELPDESGYPIEDAGSVFVYRRYDDIAGQKANYYLEDQLMLPSGYRRDYISKTINNLLCYPPSLNNIDAEFCISGQKWNIGQQGREFGSSLDVAYSGDREVIVVGAPGAKWNRKFDDIVTSGIPVGMIVFTDKFKPDPVAMAKIEHAAAQWNILYKYFAAPWPGNIQPYLDIKLLICELAFSNQSKSKMPPTSIFYHTILERLDDESLTYNYAYNSMLSGIKDIFFKAFPHSSNSLHSGIPPILGIFEDNSPSTTNTSAFKPVVDDFLKFYQEYAYRSGVIDINTFSADSGYYNIIDDVSEKWNEASINLINTTLDTGHLITNDALKYITSGVGQQWAKQNAYEFQIPPSSGGAVFIFEKEFNKFNLIQKIESPRDQYIKELPEVSTGDNEYIEFGPKQNDFFGHAVSISENGEVIAVGSPYASEPCQIYERNDSETQRMYDNLRNWLSYNNFINELNLYDNINAASGTILAQQVTYQNLSPTNKFFLRTDENFWKDNGGTINLYKKIFKYDYLDIPYTGTWKFIPEEFAGTSRLGFSVAVDDDGNDVAFGAPTDSFNEFDDTNMWYREEDTWSSYTNAGAVRLFNARKYYPHNLVVEYYKFGNLDMNAHPEEKNAGYYDQMGVYFEPSNIPFERTDFSELEIPQDAGLTFIITPEIDAASDEIINNIKDWLSLGDRTLVLVGNDPLWEDNGLYKKSNDIINKILSKLNSRMRIHPARNKYESLPNCISNEDIANQKYNVTSSFVPEYAHETYIQSRDIFAKGVGDIKIDLTLDSLTGLFIPSQCYSEDSYCSLPLKHNGDLRAEWEMSCVKTSENGEQTIVKYKENWPWHFTNRNPVTVTGCDQYPIDPKPYIVDAYQDPRPILVAAEWTEPFERITPARSGTYTKCDIVYETITENTPYWTFAENNYSNVEFNVQEDINSNLSGIYYLYDQGTFFDPNEILGRDALLQATGVAYDLDIETKNRKIADQSILVSQETYKSTSSSIVLIASLLPESPRSLGYNTDDGVENKNSDQNIYFYNNLVLQNCSNNGNIAQVGLWTNRTSFTDAYEDSCLLKLFKAFGHSVIENYSYGDIIDDTINVLWIANPDGIPSNGELNTIKNWLTNGNKKLVITYSNNQEIADNVKYICNELDINSEPLYSNSQNEFIVDNSANIERSNQQACCPPQETLLQQVNNDNSIIVGCANGYYWKNINTNTQVQKLAIIPENTSNDEFKTTQYIPIKPHNNIDKVIYFNQELYEKYYVTPVAWKINAESSVEFNVLPGSGYRMYISYVSEKPNEKYRIFTKIDNVSVDPNPNNNDAGSESTYLTETSKGEIYTTAINFRVPTGIDKIYVNFDTKEHYKINASEVQDTYPATPRIIGVSGYLLPVEEKISTNSFQRKKGQTCKEILWYVPEEKISIPSEFRPIKTSNQKYCLSGSCGGTEEKLIADGPVVVAEEYENFSNFDNGQSKSRIVLITDSTMIQGQCPMYRNNALYENQAFIRSLYPPSPKTVTGRQFSFSQKILAPERGSPAKYYGVSGINKLIQRFGLNGSYPNNNYTSDENNYDPTDLYRPSNPITEEARKEALKDFGIYSIAPIGVFPRMSGSWGVDAGIFGGPGENAISKKLLDFDQTFISGYPGDLFGYSLDLHNGKLIVGAPFHGFASEQILSWSNGSGNLKLSGNGGAGAVFYYEKTNNGENYISEDLPWEFKQKIKPSCINVGVDNSYSNSGITDQFGYAVSIDADFAAIGAPGHDYDTLHEHIYNSGNFIRKEFNAEFDIPLHKYYDLGCSGNRNIYPGSGTEILNNGAVFTFNHKIYDWPNKLKRWEYAQKLVAQGYNSRNNNSTNDFFGRSVSIDRVGRGDSDYTLIIGAPHHKYATSGNHISSQPLDKAGAVYTYDAMLREQLPAIPNSGSWIRACMFGDKPSPNQLVCLTVNQNTTGNPITYHVSGLVFANKDGNIYLEASGYDPSSKGFIAHRPFVESIIGSIITGTEENNDLNLIIEGKPPVLTGNMNLIMSGDPSAFVYNNLPLHTSSWTAINVGSGNDPFYLRTIGTSGISSSQNLTMFVSGVGLINIGSGNPAFNLRIRGR